MTVKNPEAHLASLAQIRDAAQQRAFISNTPGSATQALIESISTKIRELLPRDPDLARVFAETSLHIASLVDTPVAWAYANRSRAQVLYTMRKSTEAEPFFDRAAQLFEKAELSGEFGRTLVGQMDNLMYLSRYEEALTLADRARAALEKANDTQYLSTLEIALGNYYYRLNQYNESLMHYDRAQKTLENTDNYLAIAAIGLNRAHVLTEMNRFDEAVQCFELTKEHCERHGMELWAAMADRGISHMHFMRGNYSTSLRILEQVRHKHEKLDDARRVGLCDMDRAEIYLELNLFEDAVKNASRAFETFERLGNRYEAGKCLTYQGIAEFKLLNDKDAEKAFMSAREIFLKEGNEVWVAVLDLWRAQLLIRQQQFSTAQELAQHSAEIFEKQQVPARAANARVLSAQSWLELEETAPALEEAQKALDEIEGYHAPWVSYQCFNTLGRLKELNGAVDEAERYYMKAIDELESLRGNIRLDELRMSFGRDKYQVYENIVNLKLGRGDFRAAFQFVERSKSRTLIDLLEKNLETLWDPGDEESPRLQRIRKIREELNIFYTRLNEAGATARSAVADTATKEEISRREQELVELLREVGSEKSGWATLQSMKLPDVAEVQAVLRPDEVLVEYYAIGDGFHAFIVGHNDFRIAWDLTTTLELRTSLKGLTFQLSKFHLQPAYVQSHAPLLLAAIQHHLRDLYRQLIAPIEEAVGDRSLVIVPHHVLHYVPFQALYDGEHYLVDSHDISYAASASVLKICREKNIQTMDEDLVLAVADEMTPYINDEVAALRELLPKARVFVGAEAREDKLRQYGPSAGKLHIAAHGIFRADNPMFSSLRLGDSWLNLFDIFNLQLGAELTVLSACETGMSAVWEGDELLGLARGFLYAGTPSLVVSLWTVNDRSTAQLMRRFYQELNRGLSKSKALQQAVLEVKAEFPHPYYWAPFILMGKS
ncbi:MAG: CHAT domain-containing protein [Acidobacteria bacterium]|nr:CHAT domain-containing protein [Acidobacteriota bacterium]